MGNEIVVSISDLYNKLNDMLESGYTLLVIRVDDEDGYRGDMALRLLAANDNYYDESCLDDYGSIVSVAQ